MLYDKFPSKIYASQEADCYKLYWHLNSKLKGGISFSGNPYCDSFQGTYIAPYHNLQLEQFITGLPFFFRFNEKSFLRISVGNYSIYDYTNHSATFGEKLAALSDFYEALKNVYGDPDVFYTKRNDPKGLLTFEWFFIKKEETIKRLKEITDINWIGRNYYSVRSISKWENRFDEEQFATIIFLREEEKTKGYNLSPVTKKLIGDEIGLPFEMINLLNENIEDFIKYKKGKEVKINENSRVDGYPVTSYDKKLTLGKRKK